MRSKWFAFVCILVMLVISAVLYNQLPAQIPIHWGITGAVNKTIDKAVGALIVPGISFLAWLMLLAAPSIDPLRESYKLFPPTSRLVINLIVLFLAVIHVTVLGNALGWNISTPRIRLIMAGLLVALLGNQFGRLRPNWLIGIRTPWTLSDPEVWKQTHRMGGRIFVAAGLLSAIFVLLLPIPLAIIAFTITLLGATGLIAAYSYLSWRQLHTQ